MKQHDSLAVSFEPQKVFILQVYPFYIFTSDDPSVPQEAFLLCVGGMACGANYQSGCCYSPYLQATHPPPAAGVGT